MKNIILGVTGSIAAYKAADIANELHKKGYNVHCILTSGGSRFITPLTLETLSKNRCYEDTFSRENPQGVDHIDLAIKADLFVVAPASADFIAKAAVGLADDMLSTTYLALRNVPVLIAPAMNVRMYENPLTQRNLRILEKTGAKIIEPREAYLADGETGKGALARVEDILSVIENELNEKCL